MKSPTRGRKLEQIEWTIAKASAEFGVDRETLAGAIRRGGIEPAFRGKLFNTQQIVSALFGDYDAQRTRKVTAEADLLEMTKAEKRKTLVVRLELVEIAQRGLQAMTATVMGMTDLKIEHREKIIEQLRECGASVAGGHEGRDSTAPLHGEPVGRELSLSIA